MSDSVNNLYVLDTYKLSMGNKQVSNLYLFHIKCNMDKHSLVILQGYKTPTPFTNDSLIEASTRTIRLVEGQLQEIYRNAIVTCNLLKIAMYKTIDD